MKQYDCNLIIERRVKCIPRCDDCDELDLHISVWRSSKPSVVGNRKITTLFLNLGLPGSLNIPINGVDEIHSLEICLRQIDSLLRNLFVDYRLELSVGFEYSPEDHSVFEFRGKAGEKENRK